MNSVPAAARLQTIMIWSIALLAALFLVWPVWRAFVPMEIWGNEGWNAYHADAAMRFMDYVLRPEVSKLISDKFPYTNPNGEARKLLSPQQLANPASYPKNPPKLDIFHDIGRMNAQVEQLVTDLKSGGG